jgi:hypothetical protein
MGVFALIRNETRAPVLSRSVSTIEEDDKAPRTGAAFIINVDRLGVRLTYRDQ